MNKFFLYHVLLIIVVTNVLTAEQLAIDQLVGEKGRFANISIDGSSMVLKTRNDLCDFTCSLDDGTKFEILNGGKEYLLPFGLQFSVKIGSAPSCLIFSPLPEPLTNWGYQVEFSNGDRHRPKTYSCFNGNIVFLGRTPGSKLVVTLPTIEAAMAALKDAGIDPTKSPPQEKATETPATPNEYGILTMEDLVGEKGIFESIECDGRSFYLIFKNSGEKYNYSNNYTKPVENKPGEEITVPICGKFSLTGNGVTLSLKPIPDQILKTDGFDVTKEVELSSSGKGLVRLEGYLLVAKRSGKGKNAVMTYPAISAGLSVVRQGKWSFLSFEYLYGPSSPIEEIACGTTKYNIKLKPNSYPTEYFLNGNRQVLIKQGDKIVVPCGSIVQQLSGSFEIYPLPEPLKNNGIDIRVNSNALGYKEGFLLFTGRKKDGKPEAIMTDPFLPAAIAAFEKAKQEGK